jgi:spermidine/putrescine transport system permease protein
MSTEFTQPALVRIRNWRWLGPWLQLSPAAIIYAIFFVTPVAILVTYSFYTFREYNFDSDLTFANYKYALTNEVFRTLFLRTIKIATIVSALVVLLAYPFAWILTFVLPKHRQVLYFLVVLSLFGGYLVRIYAWRTMLGREGLINTTLVSIGLINEPVRFLLNSQYAIVVVMVNFLLPLGVLPIYNAMQNVSPKLIDAARDLGSGPGHILRRIIIPLTMRGVVTAVAFSFIATAAEWVTPLLVGGTGDQMVGNEISYQFGTAINWPLGAALAITLIVAVIAFVGFILGLLRLVIK